MIGLWQRALRRAREEFYEHAFRCELRWLTYAAQSPITYAIAFNRKPVGGPFGGGNQWLTLISRHLAALGWRVRYDLERPVDAIVILNVTGGEEIGMSVEQIDDYKRREPHVRVVHRLNESDKHRGSTHLDARQKRASQIADFSIFVSEWLLDYHSWFNRSRPHAVIHSGADDRVFFPSAERARPPRPFRLVTHHWSDNWAKGFQEYLEIDRLIAAGKLPDTELWVIGRWPREIKWQSAHLFPPCASNSLAALLRQCDAYVTASRFEAGAMHHVEAAQCGLPILYHQDSGGTVEVAKRYGLAFDSRSLAAAIQECRQRYSQLREAVLCHRPSGTTMCNRYSHIFEQAMNTRAPATHDSNFTPEMTHGH